MSSFKKLNMNQLAFYEPSKIVNNDYLTCSFSKKNTNPKQHNPTERR